ncbi:hypothetical protein NEOC95_002019 [Neochlamydia sp. AcF95]|nr:hypothetical protein [Neochlamydia sp. AcF95]
MQTSFLSSHKLAKKLIKQGYMKKSLLIHLLCNPSTCYFIPFLIFNPTFRRL